MNTPMVYIVVTSDMCKACKVYEDYVLPELQQSTFPTRYPYTEIIQYNIPDMNVNKYEPNFIFSQVTHLPYEILMDKRSYDYIRNNEAIPHDIRTQVSVFSPGSDRLRWLDIHIL